MTTSVDLDRARPDAPQQRGPAGRATSPRSTAGARATRGGGASPSAAAAAAALALASAAVVGGAAAARSSPTRGAQPLGPARLRAGYDVTAHGHDRGARRRRWCCCRPAAPCPRRRAAGAGGRPVVGRLGSGRGAQRPLRALRRHGHAGVAGALPGRAVRWPPTCRRPGRWPPPRGSPPWWRSARAGAPPWSLGRLLLVTAIGALLPAPADRSHRPRRPVPDRGAGAGHPRDRRVGLARRAARARGAPALRRPARRGAAPVQPHRARLLRRGRWVGPGHGLGGAERARPSCSSTPYGRLLLGEDGRAGACSACSATAHRRRTLPAVAALAPPRLRRPGGCRAGRHGGHGRARRGAVAHRAARRAATTPSPRHARGCRRLPATCVPAGPSPVIAR